MFRTSDVVLIAVMVAAAAFTYKTKHDAEDQLSQLRKLQAQIRFEEDTISILKADWSLLTQPSRLQRLAEIYQDELQLQSVEAHQIAGFEDLPMPLLEIDEFLTERLGGMADAETDDVVTGGTVQ